jgi:signal transduction histidine kinase
MDKMQVSEQLAGVEGTDRRRVEAVVETLARLGSRGESLAEVTHDVRNMVTALGLYCDLLEEPGVLVPAYRHYGAELRLVAAASRRLVEKLVALDAQEARLEARQGALPVLEELPEELSEYAGGLKPEIGGRGIAPSSISKIETGLIGNLAAELAANRNLLAALAGPSVALTVETEGGALPVGINGEDLTRILVNLVKNASEQMSAGGRVQIAIREQDAGRVLTLAVEDNGPGLPSDALEKIFETGYTTHGKTVNRNGWPATHRGLGLSITRSIVEAAGGRISASNRAPKGARFEIELPVR